jgi:hypothetical protein
VVLDLEGDRVDAQKTRAMICEGVLRCVISSAKQQRQLPNSPDSVRRLLCRKTISHQIFRPPTTLFSNSFATFSKCNFHLRSTPQILLKNLRVGNDSHLRNFSTGINVLRIANTWFDAVNASDGEEFVRTNSLEEFEKEMGRNSLFSNTFKPTISMTQFRSQYQSLQNAQKLTEETHSIAGRLHKTLSPPLTRTYCFQACGIQEVGVL